MSRRPGTNKSRRLARAEPRRTGTAGAISVLLVLAGIVAWIRTGLLLYRLEFHVYRYEIGIRDTGPDAGLAVLLVLAVLLGVGAWQAVRASGGAADRSPALWLLASAAVPLADALRAAGVAVPVTFLEPLWFAFVSGMAAWRTVLCRIKKMEGRPSLADAAAWPVVIALATAAFAVWCYWESVDTYSIYQLGFADFGDHGRRVVDTWEGRGLLTRSPQWAPFFDHFDGGLVVLSPLWGLWPDARLFFLVQAACLAVPAVCVYGIARRLGATKIGAASWAAAYLAFPAVGQLNLNFSYGWHDVSLALPLVAAAFWAHLAGRRWLALGLAALACTFKEEVFVFLAGLGFGLAVFELRERWRSRRAVPPEVGQVGPGLTRLQPWQWLAVSALFAVGFFVVSRSFGLTENPTVWKFKNLGSSSGEIALSPLIRPREFWGQVFQSDSIYYLLALLVPAGLPLVVRGWPILIALGAPWMVLLAWQFDAARSIAFQYVTVQIPVIFLAAMIGAVRRRPERLLFDRLLPGGAMALAAGAVASFYFGALPFSGVTIPFTRTDQEKALMAPQTAALDRAVAMVDHPDASVIASGRLASHLLGVRRLEMVGFAMESLGGLAREAGEGRCWIEVFDWVAVDLNDRLLHHDLAELKTVVMAAEDTGYRLMMAERGVLVYCRPGVGETVPSDPLAAWRLPDAEIQRITAHGKTSLEMADFRVFLVRSEPIRNSVTSAWQLEIELVFQATADCPAEYQFVHIFRDAQGEVVDRLGSYVPVGGNRPTSWWKKGEAWRERYVLPVRQGHDPARLRGEIRAEMVHIGE
ncbi:MAG: DUF2079 domain-containing protein [Pirellulales bacterium]|nr:DUF2079 domain-containing protein [Pirellulales bacterium]